MMAGRRARRIWVLGLCGVLAACGIGIGIGAGAPRAAPAPRQAQAASPATPLFAYYYMWFSRSSWSRAKKDLPLIGGYSSSDPAVLRHQIRQAKSAGIGGFIVSWKDTPLNDVRLRLLMTAGITIRSSPASSCRSRSAVRASRRKSSSRRVYRASSATASGGLNATTPG